MNALETMDALFSASSVRDVLLFLLVHKEAYGNQLARALNRPLSPIQLAIKKLSQAQILLAMTRGKTCFYRLNPANVFMSELEAMLKKALIYLPQDVRLPYFNQSMKNKNLQLEPKQEVAILRGFWERLKQVKSLDFSAQSMGVVNQRWPEKGKGSVTLELVKPHTIVTIEKGTWYNQESKGLDFSNSFRWTLDLEKRSISLEHLRRGKQMPVFLFCLGVQALDALASTSVHVCGKDIYFGNIHFSKGALTLKWRVIGLLKNEALDYVYT